MLRQKSFDPKISDYERIVNEMDDHTDKNSGQVCSICFEEYKEDRKRVAFGCGHSTCNECSRKNGRRSKLCPFCRAEIKIAIPLINN